MSKEFLAKKKEIDELKINKANASDVYTKQEVNNKITEKVSEIVAEAPEDFDTLKEMSDWINNHEDSAAAMNTAINNKLDKTTTYAASDRTGGAATYVKTYAADNFDKERSIPFTNYTVGTNSGDIQLVTNEQFTYNPATETLKVKNLEAENINQALDNKLDNDTTYAASDRTGGAAARLKVNSSGNSSIDNPIFFKGSYNEDHPEEVDTYVDSDFTYKKSTKTLKVKNLEAENINQALGNKLDKTTTYAVSDRTGGAATRLKVNPNSSSNIDNPVFFKGTYSQEYPNEVDTYIDSDFTYKKSTKTLKVKNLESDSINALQTAVETNADNISTHETKLNSVAVTLSAYDSRITTAQQKADSVDEKADNTNEVVGQLSNSLQSAFSSINNKLDKTTAYASSDRTGGAASRVKINSSSGSNVDNPVFFKGSYNSEYPNEVDIYSDSDFTYKKSTKTLKVGNIVADNINALQTAVETNAKNISTHETKLTSIGNTINNKLDKTTTYAASDRTGGAASRVKINSSGTGNADNPVFFRGTFSQEYPNEVDTFVDSDFTYKNSTKTLKVKNIESDSINALQTSIETNAQNISTHETRLNSIDNTLSGYDTRIIAAQQKADSVDEKADATNTVVGKLSNSLQSAFSSINNKLDKTTAYASSDRTGGAASRVKINSSSGSNVDNPVFFKGSYNSEYPNEVDTYVDSDFTYKKSTKTLKVKNLDAENITESLNNIGSSVNKNKSDIALNRTTLGTQWQCKNLLKYTAVTTTINGITFTVNADGTITAKGTATANAIFKFATLTLKAGTYKYSGISIAPSTSTANMSVFRTSDWVGLCALAEKNSFTITADTKIECRAVIYSGYTANNVVFYPMIRYADITDDTYEPYKESVDERLIQNKSDIAVNKTTLGYSKKNLFDWEVSNKAQNFYTTVTSETDTTISMSSKTKWSRISYKLPTVEIGKSYILSVKISDLDESGGDSAKILLSSDLSGNNVIRYVNLSNDGVYEINFSVQENADSVYLLLCPNWSGTTYTNSANSFTVSEIMLRYADITDSTYEPYSDNVDTRLTKNKSDIAVVKSTLGYQCKNLLKIVPRTLTSNGVTCVIDDDGVVTLNGTATEVTFIILRSNISLDETHEYTLTGTYDNSSYGYIYYQFGETVDGTKRYNDFGNGVTFKGTYGEVALRISPGRVLNNVKYYPMLRYADITDNTYEPYKPSLQEQINNFGTQQSRIALWSPSSGIVNNANVSCAGLFTKYSSVICIVGYSEGLRSLTLPLKYIKSLGTSQAYYPEKNLEIKYVNDDQINIKDTASSDAVIGRVDIINLY